MSRRRMARRSVAYHFPTNLTHPHVSGLCLLMTPWGEHTQLSSATPSGFSYAPSTNVNCHWTGEKLIRHTSRGGDGEPIPR